MKDQFATYEVSKQLKELGFKETCLRFYFKSQNLSDRFVEDSDIDCIAPLWQQAKQWLWEKYGISIIISATLNEKHDWEILENFTHIMDSESFMLSPITAEIEGITKAVEYLHKQLNP